MTITIERRLYLNFWEKFRIRRFTCGLFQYSWKSFKTITAFSSVFWISSSAASGSRDWVWKFLFPAMTAKPSTESQVTHCRGGSHVSQTSCILETTRSSSGVITTIRVTRARSEILSFREKSGSWCCIIPIS